MRNAIKTKTQGEQQLQALNALLQNELRAPIDHRKVRELVWQLADVEADIIGLEIRGSVQEPDLPQDSVFLRTVQ